MADQEDSSHRYGVCGLVLSIVSLITGIICFSIPYWVYLEKEIKLHFHDNYTARVAFNYGFWDYCSELTSPVLYKLECEQVEDIKDFEIITASLTVIGIVSNGNAVVNQLLFLCTTLGRNASLSIATVSDLIAGIFLLAAVIVYGTQTVLVTYDVPHSTTIPAQYYHLHVAFWLVVMAAAVSFVAAVVTGIQIRSRPKVNEGVAKPVTK